SAGTRSTPGSAQAASPARRDVETGRDVLLDLLRDDRHARVAHDHRRGTADISNYLFHARTVRSRVSRSGGGYRTLLALRRYRLDFSVSVAVPARPSLRALISL